jgi:hypothetical protein
MFNRLLADFIVLFHLAFILFVLFGGLLVLKWKRLVWLHLPAFAWGVLIEFVGWWCPLTPWENALRMSGGETPYQSGFIEHYILPIIYPPGLTREVQIVLGAVVILVNTGVYGWIWHRRRSAAGTRNP